MSFKFGSEKSKTKQKSVTQPWQPAIAPTKSFIGQIGNEISQGYGPSETQTSAYEQIKSNLSKANPNTANIDALATDLFNSTDYAPGVGTAYEDYKRRLAPTADGANLDIANNPYLQQMLTEVADDAQNRINAQFAAAGRQRSGINQRSVAQGVSSAKLPILFDQYNREQGRTDAAARDIYSGAQSSAQTQSSLDNIRAQLRASGIDVGNAALDAANMAPGQLLELEQKMKMLPYDEMSKIASLLFPAAKLGGTETGTAKGSSSSMGLDLGILNFGRKA